MRVGYVRRRLLPLRANTLACALEHVGEEVVEPIDRRRHRVEPLGWQQLSPRALVRDARLEAGEQPSVDVVFAHHTHVGICA